MNFVRAPPKMSTLKVLLAGPILIPKGRETPNGCNRHHEFSNGYTVAKSNDPLLSRSRLQSPILGCPDMGVRLLHTIITATWTT